MPRSKRDKRISLTRTKKKGLEAKQNLVDEIRKSVELYDRVFIFSVYNMRNSKLKEVRSAWRHSRFFYGKNKVMAIAFGKTPETEVMTGLHKLSDKLVNDVGVLFTNKPKDEVISWFDKYCEHDYARAGNIATSTVELDEGPLHQFSHAIEPHLRKLGLPVTLTKGIVTMRYKHVVCTEGDPLSTEQARILKLLQIVMAQFSIELKCVWDKPSEEFEMIDAKPKDQVFNVVRVKSDDQEYDFVENKMDDEITENVDNSSKIKEESPEPAINAPSPIKMSPEPVSKSPEPVKNSPVIVQTPRRSQRIKKKINL